MTRYSEEPSAESFLRDIARRVSVLETTPARIPTGKLTTTSGSIPNGNWVDVGFTGQEYDLDDIVDVVANPTELVLQSPGVYTISGALTYIANATGGRSLRLLRVRGGVVTEGPRFGPVAPSSGANDFGMSLTWDTLCLAGDRFRLSTIQASGGNLAVVRAHLSVKYFSSTPEEE